MPLRTVGCCCVGTIACEQLAECLEVTPAGFPVGTGLAAVDIEVVISGVTSLACETCGDLNDTFLFSPQEPVDFDYDFPPGNCRLNRSIPDFSCSESLRLIIGTGTNPALSVSTLFPTGIDTTWSYNDTTLTEDAVSRLCNGDIVTLPFVHNLLGFCDGSAATVTVQILP